MEGPGSWKETRHADLDLKEETQGRYNESIRGSEAGLTRFFSHLYNFPRGFHPLLWLQV